MYIEGSLSFVRILLQSEGVPFDNILVGSAQCVHRFEQLGLGICGLQKAGNPQCVVCQRSASICLTLSILGHCTRLRALLWKAKMYLPLNIRSLGHQQFGQLWSVWGAVPNSGAQFQSTTHFSSLVSNFLSTFVIGVSISLFPSWMSSKKLPTPHDSKDSWLVDDAQ